MCVGVETGLIQQVVVTVGVIQNDQLNSWASGGRISQEFTEDPHRTSPTSAMVAMSIRAAARSCSRTWGQCPQWRRTWRCPRWESHAPQSWENRIVTGELRCVPTEDIHLFKQPMGTPSKICLLPFFSCWRP